MPKAGRGRRRTHAFSPSDGRLPLALLDEPVGIELAGNGPEIRRRLLVDGLG